MMVMGEKKGDAQDARTRSASIEWVTENGYSIVRACDENGNLLDGKDGYCFVVISPDGLKREVIVEFDPTAIALIQRFRLSPLSAKSSFWINCAERSLATYLWEEDEYPPNSRLILKELCLEELDAARRCDND